jgi:hypothetical protein
MIVSILVERPNEYSSPFGISCNIMQLIEQSIYRNQQQGPLDYTDQKEDLTFNRAYMTYITELLLLCVPGIQIRERVSGGNEKSRAQRFMPSVYVRIAAADNLCFIAVVNPYPN